MELERYTAPGEFIDSADVSVQEFAKKAAEGAGDDVSRAVKLYYAVRDEVLYDPYCSGEERLYSGPAIAWVPNAGSASRKRHCSPRPRARLAYRREWPTPTCAIICPRRNCSS